MKQLLFPFNHLNPSSGFSEMESVVCGPYTGIQLCMLLNDSTVLSDLLYPLLVDWDIDCLLCDGDAANTTTWTTRMKATRFHNNAIYEGIACDLISVVDYADGTRFNLYCLLTDTYASLSLLFFQKFCHSNKCIV